MTRARDLTCSMAVTGSVGDDGGWRRTPCLVSRHARERGTRIQGYTSYTAKAPQQKSCSETKLGQALARGRFRRRSTATRSAKYSFNKL